MSDAPLTYPVFISKRGPDAEADSVLHFNTFGRHRYPTARQLRELDDIIRHLRAQVQAGRLPPGSRVVGWPGVGLKPYNAVDTDDEAVMAGWCARAYRVEVALTDDERILVNERTRG